MRCDGKDLREVKVMKVYFLYPEVCLCDIAYLYSGGNSLEINSVENSIDLFQSRQLRKKNKREFSVYYYSRFKGTKFWDSVP